MINIIQSTGTYRNSLKSFVHKILYQCTLKTEEADFRCTRLEERIFCIINSLDGDCVQLFLIPLPHSFQHTSNRKSHPRKSWKKTSCSPCYYLPPHTHTYTKEKQKLSLEFCESIISLTWKINGKMFAKCSFKIYIYILLSTYFSQTLLKITILDEQAGIKLKAMKRSTRGL